MIYQYWKLIWRKMEIKYINRQFEGVSVKIGQGDKGEKKKVRLVVRMCEWMKKDE